MFKRTWMLLLVSISIIVMSPPSSALIIVFDNSEMFLLTTNIVDTETFETFDSSNNEGLFPAVFNNFVFDDDDINPRMWHIGNASFFNIPDMTNGLYPTSVGIHYFRFNSPLTAFGFDFASGHDPRVIGNTINIEVTETNEVITT